MAARPTTVLELITAPRNTERHADFFKLIFPPLTATGAGLPANHLRLLVATVVWRIIRVNSSHKVDRERPKFNEIITVTDALLRAEVVRTMS